MKIVFIVFCYIDQLESKGFRNLSNNINKITFILSDSATFGKFWFSDCNVLVFVM